MRQVPHYLLIGNGRVAKHFQTYFTQLSLPYSVWHRQLSNSELQNALVHSTHVMVLIRDDAIESFIKARLCDYQGTILHCSGSVNTDLAFGAHPLMTFSITPYTRDVYESMPFIIDHDAPAFNDLLPGLPNRYERLNRADKVKYHALCVMSGNFSCLLWQQLFEMLQGQCHWPPEIAFPYLQQQMKNVMDHPMAALTGPLARQDHGIINRHLAALAGHPLHDLYQAFIDFYHARHKERSHECI